MKTKFGLLSIRFGLDNSDSRLRLRERQFLLVTRYLLLFSSLVYPSNGILMPGQSQVVQVAAAIQPSPGTPIHAYLLMLKVRDQKGNALFVNSFYPTQSDSLAGLNMKKLSPGAYTVTAQLQYNGTSLALRRSTR